MTTALVVPEQNTEAMTAVEQAKSLIIVTSDDYSNADQFCAGLKDLEKKVDLAFDEHISDAFKAHRNLVAKKKIYAAPIDEARRLVKGKMIVWKDEQDRIAREKAEADARTAKEKSDAEALSKAQQLEQQGDHEAAAIIVEEAANMPVLLPKFESSVPKGSTVFSVRWGATITDPDYVLKAIEAAGKLVAESKTTDSQKAAELLRQAYTDAKYMVYDQVALNRQATATKDAMKLGGVVFTSRKV